MLVHAKVYTKKWLPEQILTLLWQDKTFFNPSSVHVIFFSISGKVFPCFASYFS